MSQTPRTYALVLWLLILLASLAGAECDIEMSCCCEPVVSTCEMESTSAAIISRNCGCSLESERPPTPSAAALLNLSRVDIQPALISLVASRIPTPKLYCVAIQRPNIGGLPPPRLELPHPVFPNPPPAAA